MKRNRFVIVGSVSKGLHFLFAVKNWLVGCKKKKTVKCNMKELSNLQEGLQRPPEVERVQRLQLLRPPLLVEVLVEIKVQPLLRRGQKM